MNREIERLKRSGARNIPNAAYGSSGKLIINRTGVSTVQLLCVAATSVLNRVGEIDSGALFDDFILRQKKSGIMPELRFYHQDEPIYRLGHVTHTLRNKWSYMAVAEFDLSNPLSVHLVSAIENNPDYWGVSIGYKPEGQPELVRTDKGIVQVFKAGFNHEISILPEKDAASYFTSVNIN